MFGGTGPPDLIAYEVNGGPVGPEGFARVVVPGDQFGGRYGRVAGRPDNSQFSRSPDRSRG
jgi:hypothetical protein